MIIVTETDRLLLRTFTENDALLMYDLNLDLGVTRYTHDPVKDLARAAEILEKVIIPQYILYNRGRWAVLEKPGLNPIAIGLKKNHGVRDMLLKLHIPQSNVALRN